MLARDLGAVRVLCVKYGSKYGPEWVLRLRSMVAKHLTYAHEFVCLTENPIEGVDCRPLGKQLPTWWSKLSLFEPGAFPGENLYLDLDVVLTANIDGLVDAARTDTARLWMRDDFSYSLRKPREGLGSDMTRLLGGPGCCNSSVMLWSGDAVRRAWDDFKPEVMDRLHGDQNYLSALLWPNQIGLLPDELVCSFKYHIERGQAQAPVVVFHGQPKTCDLPRNHGLRKLWENAA